MARLNQGPDVTVLENQALTVLCWPDGDIDHGPSQVVGPNHLVRKQHPKRWVERTHKPVGEIRFLPRLHGVDVRWPEDVNVGKTYCEHCLLGLTLVAREGKPTSSRGVCAVPAQE